MNTAMMAVAISRDIPVSPRSHRPIGMASWPKSGASRFRVGLSSSERCCYQAGPGETRPMDDLKLAIAGAAGRMGRTLTRVARETPGIVVAGGLEAPQSPAIGADMGALAGIGPIGVAVTADAPALLAGIDAVVDFTSPAASLELAALAAQARIVHVLGTTGLKREHDAALVAAARHARIVRSGNMSVGVNLLAALVRRVAATLGEEFDIEILEMHHRHKVDAPSGTALLLGSAAAAGRAVELGTAAVRTRDGHTGPRPSGGIGFATLRGG